MRHVPAGIDATGATDVSAKLSAWLCKNRDEGPFYVEPESTYRVDDGLTFQYCHGLDLSPWGTERPRSNIFTDDPAMDDRSRCLIRAWGSNPITIGPIRCLGPNFGKEGPPIYHASVEAQAGLEISNMSDGVTVLDGFAAWGTWGDGIYIGANQCGLEAPKNVSIGNVRCANNGRMCIGIANADGVTITGARLGPSARSCIDLEPITPCYVRHVMIDGVTSVGVGLSWIAAQGTGDVSNVTIRNCHANEGLILNQYPPPGVARRTDWTVVNNTSDWLLSGANPPFNIGRTTGVTIAGNHQPVLVGPTPQTRRPWTDKAMARWLLGNGCKNVVVGDSIYADDGTVAGPSGLPPNTWQ